MKRKSKISLTTLVLCLSLSASSFSERINERVKFDSDKIINEYDICNDSYVIQGITYADKYILVSAYNDSLDKSSKVYVFDRDFNYLNEILLNNNSHVGGITYDDKNNLVWITDVQGTISAYDLDLIVTGLVIPKYDKLDVSKDLVNLYANSSVAYICYNDGYLYLGDYTIEPFSTLKVYKVLSDGSIDTLDYEKYSFYNLVQGLSIFQYNGDDYMLVSSSMSNKFKSNLKLVKLKDFKDKNKECNNVNFEMPNMLEQIYLNDDELYSVYESNSDKYYKGVKHSSDILINDFEEEIKTYVPKL